MKKSKLEIYALAICFVTIVCAAVSLGFGIWGIIEIVNPGFTMDSYEYERFQSNDKYYSNPYSYRYGGVPDNSAKTLSEEDKSKKRLDNYNLALRSEKHSGGQAIVRVLIIITIDLFVFIIHWIIARRARETSIAA